MNPSTNDNAISPPFPLTPGQPPFWLAGLLMSFIGFHLMLTARCATDGFLTLSCLFWLAVAYSIWGKRKTLDLHSDLGATLVGGGLLGVSLVMALTVLRYPSQLVPLQFLPFFGGLGCALLASSFRGLNQYVRELAILFFLGFPPVLLRAIPLNMTVITAKFSTFLLWYAGWNVTRTDDVIRFSSGSIFVFPDCSGIEMMAYLWSLATLIGIFLGLPLASKLALALLGIAFGFVLNGVRVVMLTLFVAIANPALFKFWHEGSGSLIFSGVGALMLSLLGYWFLHMSEPAEDPLAGFER